jgi:hypothetical protein
MLEDSIEAQQFVPDDHGHVPSRNAIVPFRHEALAERPDVRQRTVHRVAGQSIRAGAGRIIERP